MVDPDSVSEVMRLYRKYFSRDAQVISSAPARLDLLNTHQDYKGLPVISVAINMRFYIAVSKSKKGHSRIISHNLRVLGLEHEDKFRMNNVNLALRTDWFGNYFRAVFKYLKALNYGLEDVDILAFSQIPMGSGLGSSGALLVSLLTALNELFGLGFTPNEVAEHAYRVEHDLMGIPCGRLDQYTATFGGHLLIRTKPSPSVEKLKIKNALYAVFDSGVKHKTLNVHKARQRELIEAIKILLSLDIPDSVRVKLNLKLDEVDWGGLSEESLKDYLNKLPSRLKKRLLFTLRMNESTEAFIRAVKYGINSVPYNTLRKLGLSLSEMGGNSKSLLEFLGIIMTYQHTLLRDLYEVSIDVIDKIVEKVISNGALGAKLSGAGMGGVAIALIGDIKDSIKIVNAGLEAGATNAWIAYEDEGAKVH